MAKKNKKPMPAASAAPAQAEPAAAPDDAPFPRQGAWFAALMACAVVFRLLIGLTTKRHLQSDEALIGMIVLDILDGKPIPIFPYGNAYAGGHIIEALMMAPLFKLFGSSGAIVATVPAMIGCGYVAVVYATLYRHFNRRLALASAAVMAFFPAFLEFNFYENGGMATSLCAWAGMFFFFEAYFAKEERPLAIFAAGAFFGVAYYGFDYALYYPIAAAALWAAKHRAGVLRQGRRIGAAAAGFAVGASPLIYVNLTHGFANLRNLANRTAGGSGEGVIFRWMRKAANLVAHDLPAFFTVDIYDFAARIPAAAWGSYLIFAAATLWAAWAHRSAIRRWLFDSKDRALPREDRLACLLAMMAIYLGIYCISSSGGMTPRYLLPLYPFIPIFLAWGALRAARINAAAGWATAAAIALAQAPFLHRFATDSTTVEWKIVTHGEDLRKLADFLKGERIATVLCPYEIKWKLMFETRRGIVCNAAPFGFDRDAESGYNREAAERINRRGEPWALVVDQGLQMPRIALHFNPGGAFDMEAFHEALARQGIEHKRTRVGRDYLVYHGFSKHITIPENR